MTKYVSKDNEYYTPRAFVMRFGRFDYDPATTKEKAAEFGIEHFDTIDTDGLKSDWTTYRRIWINPPFTIKHEFLKKAVDTFAKTKADIYILFPIEFITTKRFHDILNGWGGGRLCAQRQNQVREWSRQKSRVAIVRNLRDEAGGYIYNNYREDNSTIGGTMKKSNFDADSLTDYDIERIADKIEKTGRIATAVYTEVADQLRTVTTLMDKQIDKKIRKTCTKVNEEIVEARIALKLIKKMLEGEE